MARAIGHLGKVVVERVETRRRKETKERLLSAALEVFAETGFGAASIEQISEAAGFTRGAFYSNFSTKEDLLFALLEQKQESFIWQAETALSAAISATQPNSMEDLVSAVIDALETLPEHGRSWMLVRREMQLTALRDPEVARKFMASETAMFDRIASLLDETLGRIGRRPLISSADLARLTAAAFESSEQERLLEDPASPPASGLFTRALSAMLLQLTEKVG
jgi:AcrR family transcriptional regulator